MPLKSISASAAAAQSAKSVDSCAFSLPLTVAMYAARGCGSVYQPCAELPARLTWP